MRPKVATPAGSTPVRWQRSTLVETVASEHVSAACYRGSGDIEVLAFVVPELIDQQRSHRSQGFCFVTTSPIRRTERALGTKPCDNEGLDDGEIS